MNNDPPLSVPDSCVNPKVSNEKMVHTLAAETHATEKFMTHT
jgi:hypothetical protein